MLPKIWSLRFRLPSRRDEGRGIARYITPLTLLFLTVGSSCGVPTISYIAEPIYQRGTGDTLEFEHNPENDSEDFKGYDLYYKIYNANDTDSIDSDRSYIEAADTPGTSRLVVRNFLRMVRTDSGEPGGRGQREPPVLPVSLGARDSSFTVLVDFSAAEGTVVTRNPGESETDVSLYRQNVLLTDQTPATEFDRFLDPDAFQYIPGAPETENDADLAEMLREEYDETNTYEAAVAVIAYGIDATNFQQIYSIPIHLGTVRLE
ncbi:MAG: hypothetical protein ACOC47_08800 [Alkalispirochaetaceae bacterium]